MKNATVTLNLEDFDKLREDANNREATRFKQLVDLLEFTLVESAKVLPTKPDFVLQEVVAQAKTQGILLSVFVPPGEERVKLRIKFEDSK